MLDIEVIYATEEDQLIINVKVSAECTIEQVIKASTVLEKYPEIDLSINNVGVFSQKKELSDTLHDGDRVEIYRPLIADPKQIRRAKADVQKENKQFL